MSRERWAEEPPVTRRHYDWPSITKRLRARPGEWLCVAEQSPRSVRGAIKRQRIKSLRDPEFVYEVRTRNTNGLLADIWMSARPRTDEEKEVWDSRL